MTRRELKTPLVLSGVIAGAMALQAGLGLMLAAAYRDPALE